MENFFQCPLANCRKKNDNKSDLDDHLYYNHSFTSVSESNSELGKEILSYNIKIKKHFDKLFLVQCKLCENLIYNTYDDRKNHIIKFHRGNYFYDINSFFDSPFLIDIQNEFKSDFIVCNICSLVIENKVSILLTHLNFNHRKNYFSPTKCVNFFCNFCNRSEPLISHYHYSYMCFGDLESSKLHEKLIDTNKKIFEKSKTTNIKFELSNSLLNSFKSVGNINFDQTKLLSLASKDAKNQTIIEEVEKNPNLIKKSQSVIMNKSTLFGDSNFNETDGVATIQAEYLLYSSTERKINLQDINNLLNTQLLNFKLLRMHFESHQFLNYPRTNDSNVLILIEKHLEKIKNQLNSFESSLFLVVENDSPQLLKLLMTGERGTPYEHGLFEFDLYLPCDYPNSKIEVFCTTSQKFQFNFSPLILKDGKVCITYSNIESKLIYQHHDINEYINKLKKLLSSSVIEQGMITVIFPSKQEFFEKEGYQNIIRYFNLNYAIIESFKNPSIYFKEVIEKIFEIKSKELFHDIELWQNRLKNTSYSFTGLAFKYFSQFAEKLLSTQNNKLLELIEESILNLKILIKY